MFEAPAVDTVDADETMIAGPMLHQSVERTKDIVSAENRSRGQSEKPGDGA